MDILPQEISQSVYIPYPATNYQTSATTQNQVNYPVEDILAKSAQTYPTYNTTNTTVYQTSTEAYPATNYSNVDITTQDNAFPLDIIDNTNTYTTPITEAYPTTNYSNVDVTTSAEAYPVTNYDITTDFQTQDTLPITTNYEEYTPNVDTFQENYSFSPVNVPKYQTMTAPVSTPQYKRFYTHVPISSSIASNAPRVITKYANAPSYNMPPLTQAPLPVPTPSPIAPQPLETVQAIPPKTPQVIPITPIVPQQQGVQPITTQTMVSQVPLLPHTDETLRGSRVVQKTHLRAERLEGPAHHAVPRASAHRNHRLCQWP